MPNPDTPNRPPHRPPTDEQNSPEALFLSFLDDGDEGALARLMRRCSPRLRSFARRFGVPDDRVEDLVHESLVTAVQRARDFDRNRPLLPWLQGILTRKVASHVRAEARRARHQAARAQHHRDHAGHADPESPHPSPLDSAARSELFAILHDAILAVPEHYRPALELHLLEGLSPVEVAERLGRMRATVRVQLFRGLRALRRQLPRGLHPLLFALLLAPDRQALAAAIGEAPRIGRRLLAGSGAVLAVTLAAVSLAWNTSDTPPPTRRIASEATPVPAPTPRPKAATTDVPTPRRLSDRAAIADDRTLEVFVHDGQRRPVPAVGLWLERLDGSDPLGTRERAVTAANGIARFAALPNVGLRLQSDRLAAREVTATASRAELQVRGNDLTGIVLDPTGRPCSDAGIWLAGDVVTMTDAAGQFELRAVPSGTPIAAIAPFGVAPPRPHEPNGSHLTLRLEPAGAVRGKIVDAADRPIAGARVVVGSAPNHAEEGYADDALLCLLPTQTSIASSTGEFGPLWLPPGQHPIHVRTPRHRPFASAVSITARDTTTTRLELPTTAHLTGRIVDPDGRPIGNARLAFRGTDANDRIDTTVGADGHFALDVPERGGYLAAAATGHRSASITLAQHATLPDEAILVLEPEHWQPLRLTFDDGAPVTGWSVRWLTPTRSALDRGEQRAVTNASGVCRIARRPQGSTQPTNDLSHRPTRWAVRGPGDPVWHEQPIDELRLEPPGLRATIAAHLRPSASLTCECLAAPGRPIANGRVYLRRGQDILWESARTDDRGRFSAAPLAPGDYTVFVESTAPDQPSLHGSGITIAAGAAVQRTLTSGPSGRLDYELRRPDGALVDSAIVTFVGGRADRRYGARESGHGSQRLPVGSYRLFAMGENSTWVHGEPFEIAADRTTRLTVPVEAATRRALHLQVPGFGRDVLTAIVRRRRDGCELGTFRILEDAPPSVVAFLPLGTYDVEVAVEPASLPATTSSHGPWRGQFTVETLAPRHAAIPVSFERR
ncbi:MAG: sigma-70 family RNA polymerase sigma factor [bacterium]|nr:sigma-70 family RNA polymerase sigma factor [bacterium]